MTSEGHIHDRNGAEIKGRVWALQDKACSGGIVRTELFIHTEETNTNTQECTSATDDPWCWDSTAAPGGSTGSNDYYSQGCIKVRRNSPEGSWPNNMGNLDSDWHNRGPGGKQAGRTDTVYVHS